MGQLAINIHNYIFQIDKVTYDGDVEIEDEQWQQFAWLSDSS